MASVFGSPNDIAILSFVGSGMSRRSPTGRHASESSPGISSRLVAIDHLLGDGDWAAARLAATVSDHETVDPLGAPYAPGGGVAAG